MLRTAVKAGIGIGELPIHLAEHDGLMQMWPEPARGAVYEIWLVTHQDLRHTARIAAMIDGIVSAFEDHTTHTKWLRATYSCGCVQAAGSVKECENAPIQDRSEFICGFRRGI